MKLINKEEIKYILYASIFAMVMFLLIIPNISKIGITSPFLMFIIFNVSVFVFLQIFLKSLASNKKIKWMHTLGILLVFMAIDILIPPLVVSPSGQIAGDSGGILLLQSSSDYVISLIWSWMGVNGFGLFFVTYIVTPILLFLASSILLKNFVDEV